MEGLAALADFMEDLPGSPQFLWNEFKEGQARDEARTVRAEDIAREEKWLERNSISGRIAEGMSKGLSLTAAAGVQPGSQQSSTIGQDSGYLAMNRAGNSSNNRTERLTQQLLQSQIDHQDLQNLKLFQELEHPRTTGAPTPGDSFMPGGSQSIKGGRRIDEGPMKRTTSYPGRPDMEPGAINTQGYSITETGLMPIPSADIKERIEDSPYEWSHFYRYGITPGFGGQTGKPPKEVMTRNWPGSTGSVWNPVLLEWQPTYPPKGSRFPLGPVPKWFYKTWKKDPYKDLPLRERITPRGYYPEGHPFHRKGGK